MSHFEKRLFRKRSLRKKINSERITSKMGQCENDHFEKRSLQEMSHFVKKLFRKMGHFEKRLLRKRSLRKIGQFENDHFDKGHFEKWATSKKSYFEKCVTSKNWSLRKKVISKNVSLRKKVISKNVSHWKLNNSIRSPLQKMHFLKWFSLENMASRKKLTSKYVTSKISSFEFVLSHQLKLVIKNVAMQIEIILNYFNFRISLFRERKFAGFRWSSSTSSMSEDNHIFPLHLKHVSSFNFNTKTTGLFLILHFRNDNDLFPRILSP